jgi:hypothetical protein
MGSNFITHPRLWIIYERMLVMYIQLERDIVTPQFLQAIEAAVKIASELPGNVQNEFAQFLLDEMADWRWESTPEFLAGLQKSRAECAAGDCMGFEEFVQQWQAES